VSNKPDTVELATVPSITMKTMNYENGAFGDTDLLSVSIHEDRTTQLAISKLKPVSKDLINKWNESQGSIAYELGLFVNDSAKGVDFDSVYDKQKELGAGGFAIVYRCEHKERGNTYAVKEMFNDEGETSSENIKAEIDALKRLREGPYIVRLLDVFTAPDRTHLVMEEMRGGDLLERLQDRVIFTERESRRISRTLLEAVSFCHRKGIVHRDIKLENILLTDPVDCTRIKLADFGYSKRITGKNCLYTLCGSPDYVAPELYLHEHGYDERCDIWSSGVVMFMLLGGYAPFQSSDGNLPELICDGYFEFHDAYWNDISEEPKDLIRSLLVVNPEERASIENALDSEWLRRRDRESVLKYSNPLNGSSTNTFDAWVRLQNESSHSNALDVPPESSFATDHPEASGHDSIRSLYLDDL